MTSNIKSERHDIQLHVTECEFIQIYKKKQKNIVQTNLCQYNLCKKNEIGLPFFFVIWTDKMPKV